METKYTPGPWRPMAANRRLRGGRGMAFDVFGDCGRAVESQEYVCGHCTESDALVIAAAPDLLAEAKAFAADFQAYVDSDDYDLPDPSALLAAIAKATGAT